MLTLKRCIHRVLMVAVLLLISCVLSAGTTVSSPTIQSKTGYLKLTLHNKSGETCRYALQSLDGEKWFGELDNGREIDLMNVRKGVPHRMYVQCPPREGKVHWKDFTIYRDRTLGIHPDKEKEKRYATKVSEGD